MSPTSRASSRVAALFAAFGARLGTRVAAPADRLGRTLASAVRPFATTDRALPVVVAAIVAVASLLALLPATPSGSAGAAQGLTGSPRLVVNGDIRYLEASSDPNASTGLGAPRTAAENFQPVTLPADVPTQPTAATSPDAGSVTSDGTLVTGYAPVTTVEDGSALITMYRVRKGDTLSAIAANYHVSMMTLWWANKGSMKSKTDLHIGQLLRVPPANGVVVTVTASDTLDSIAAKYGVDAQSIVDINQLTDPTLVVGQVLIVPGARGAPIPTPRPAPAPMPAASHTSSRAASHPSGGGTSSGIGGHYSGGRMSWPVVGGNNYISQYYHYGHWAIDIAAAYGSKVVAAASGKVIFAGWKSNGGGWQVWISHGGNIYTTYNHMSALTVAAGEYVSRGHQVGRIGMSGDATGPHLHFEVWVGPVWNGGQRMNPLNYL